MSEENNNEENNKRIRIRILDDLSKYVIDRAEVPSAVTVDTSKIISTITEVYCTLRVEGLHHWPDCPLSEVSYLRDLHRHVFHIKASTIVSHDNRDVEFIVLKHQIREYLHTNYWDDEMKCLHFGAQSCEMIATDLIHTFNLARCEVSEDGENGAIVSVNSFVT